MAVSERVRAVETEIDASIREMRTWQTPRATMLERLMGVYRDSIELVFLEFMHAKVFDLLDEELGSQFAKELVDLTFLGSTYEAFVDALKCQMGFSDY